MGVSVCVCVSVLHISVLSYCCSSSTKYIHMCGAYNFLSQTKALKLAQMQFLRESETFE